MSNKEKLKHAITVLPQLAADLAEAMSEFEGAEQAESFARNRCTAALNKLNQAQKAFDEQVAALRGGAAQGSDWSREKIAACVRRAAS